MKSISLSELNGMVRQALALTFPEDYWVVAEIAEMREGNNGHCYLELVEKDHATDAWGTPFTNGYSRYDSAAGRFKARAKANIWANVWRPLKRKFERESGQPLSIGMKVLMQVHINFHEQYGYSLTINDIDTSFSIGEMARKRKEILEQLEEDGVIDLNRQLTLPRPLQRIAVISAEGAAGYGDFCKQLTESELCFRTRLFAATMQGSEVEGSIIAALNAIADDISNWDCVVIIRGGGAVTDLNGFETYLLAANIAQFPLPVITGIGHDRDLTVVDYVANTHLKTPTAVAQFIIDKMQNELKTLQEYGERLRRATENHLQQQRRQFDNIARRYERAAHFFCQHQRKQLMRLAATMQILSTSQLKQRRHHLETLDPRLRQYTENYLSRQHQRLSLAKKTLQMAEPDRILKLGFSITTDADGHVLRHPDDLKAGSLIITRLQNGIMHSIKTDEAQDS